MVNTTNEFKVGTGDQIVSDGVKSFDINAVSGIVTGAMEIYIQ